MQQNKINILCTRPVNRKLVQLASDKGFGLDCLSFIETEALQSIEVQREIQQASLLKATVVFTSMNAVDAVTHLLDGLIPEWHIYSMGYKTRELVEAYFGISSLIGTADNASELAALIIEDVSTEQVIFFCGDQRRRELPEMISAASMPLHEIVVYQTLAIHHTIEKIYDAVLFFSPSAVHSFFTNNKIADKTVVFAIGITTQHTILEYCNNQIMVSNKPGKDNMVEQAIAYFETGI